MERHLHVTETRVALTPEPVVLVVAQLASSDDTAALPCLESFRAFLLNGRQGVLLGTSAWHPLDCFPVRSRHADFVFGSEMATEKELRETSVLTEWRAQPRDQSAEAARRAFRGGRSFRVVTRALGRLDGRIERAITRVKKVLIRIRPASHRPPGTEGMSEIVGNNFIRPQMV